MMLAHKDNGRPTGMFVGDDQGRWQYWESIRLGARREGWPWEAIIGLSSRNQWRNLSVEGATEQNRGFARAFLQMVNSYPELLDFIIDFDGPKMDVRDLLGKLSGEGGEIDWPSIEFYHGTASAVAPAILRDGLKPRGAGKAVYGACVGAVEGRSDAVYLTTQLQTAHFAAREAANALGGVPTILAVRGLSGSRMAPDMDSQERTAEASLERLGSVAYVGTVAPRFIHTHSQYVNREWVTVAVRAGGKRRHARSSLSSVIQGVRRALR